MKNIIKKLMRKFDKWMDARDRRVMSRDEYLEYISNNPLPINFINYEHYVEFRKLMDNK